MSEQAVESCELCHSVCSAAHAAEVGDWIVFLCARRIVRVQSAHIANDVAASLVGWLHWWIVSKLLYKSSCTSYSSFLPYTSKSARRHSQPSVHSGRLWVILSDCGTQGNLGLTSFMWSQDVCCTDQANFWSGVYTWPGLHCFTRVYWSPKYGYFPSKFSQNLAVFGFFITLYYQHQCNCRSCWLWAPTS